MNAGLLNKTFGDWHVIDRGSDDGRHRRWLCVCTCGSVLAVRENNLTSGRSTKCRSCSMIGNRNRFTGYEGLSGDYWTTIIKGSELRNIKFDLSIEDAWKKFEKQNGQCALSGVKLIMDTVSSKNNTASLDRIDSTKGYVSSNVQWVHKEVNRMKGALPESQFTELCRLIAGNTK